MAKLLAKSAAEGLLPVTIGALTLTEVPYGAICTIAAYPGQNAALADALPAGFPAPNRSVGKDGARLLWSGPSQALWLGEAMPQADLSTHAAVTDQSDAWTVVRLEGEGVADVLARLTPIDLRPSQFKRGHTARTLLGHMMAQITKTAKGVEVIVFRSMAGTLVHELSQAMESLAARQDA